LGFVHNVRMLLLAAWLGAAIFFSVVVAPAAFTVTRSFGFPNANEIAGTIVTRTLSVVNVTGFVLSVLVLLVSLVVKRSYGRTAAILQTVLLAIVAISAGVGEWVIAPKMRELRATMRGQIDLIAPDDPNRLAFAALHGYSVAALSVAMIATLLVILLMVLSPGRTNAISTK
jgi:hypothetical protein